MAAQKTHGPAGERSQPAAGRPPLGANDRKRILDATTAVFLEKGFARAGTSEIARRAQTSKQTLYALFPTKADLFAAVMGMQTEQLFSRHAYYIESRKAPRDVLAEMGRMVLRKYRTPEFLALYRIVMAEAPHFPDLARQLWREGMQRGYGLLAEYLRSRGIGGPNYRKSAAQFVSFVIGDFLINSLLNVDFALSERTLRARVREAVEDFLRLHPARGSGKAEE